MSGSQLGRDQELSRALYEEHASALLAYVQRLVHGDRQLAEDIVQAPIALRDGMVALPEGPGLGVEVDEAAVARFRVH
jgi:L-alanine-DL-glutamate epimerase-like enolase superfamily enzyme